MSVMRVTGQLRIKFDFVDYYHNTQLNTSKEVHTNLCNVYIPETYGFLLPHSLGSRYPSSNYVPGLQVVYRQIAI